MLYTGRGTKFFQSRLFRDSLSISISFLPAFSSLLDVLHHSVTDEALLLLLLDHPIALFPINLNPKSCRHHCSNNVLHGQTILMACNNSVKFSGILTSLKIDF